MGGRGSTNKCESRQQHPQLRLCPDHAAQRELIGTHRTGKRQVKEPGHGSTERGKGREGQLLISAACSAASSSNNFCSSASSAAGDGREGGQWADERR